MKRIVSSFRREIQAVSLGLSTGSWLTAPFSHQSQRGDMKRLAKKRILQSISNPSKKLSQQCDGFEVQFVSERALDFILNLTLPEQRYTDTDDEREHVAIWNSKKYTFVKYVVKEDEESNQTRDCSSSL
jgi:hypothetical protein